MSLFVVICLVGAVGSFSLAASLRKFKLPGKPLAWRAHLSLEQRQHRFRIGTRIVYVMGWMYLAAAALLWLLEKSH